MGITQVMRGADLLSSTPRQILLHRLLGQPEPRWAHVPLVLGPGGERLSKRDQSLSLSALRARGVDPALLRAALLPEGSFSLSKIPLQPLVLARLPF